MAIDPHAHGAGGTPEPGRTLGLPAAVSMVIGTVIGSGIFLVTSQMMLSVGSTPMVLAVWVFGGILTMFGALSYAELSAAMPQSGAEYVYLKAAYGPVWGFIYGWTITWVAKPGSAAALASGGYRYLAEFFPGLNDVVFSVALPIGPGGGPLDIHKGQFLGAGLILLFSGVNMLGTRLGGGLQVAGTGLKVALIAGIILGGLATGHGSMAHFHSSLPVHSGPIHSGTDTTGGVAGFFVALVAALWAYDGWNTASMIGSEIQNPQKNLPRALIWGTVAVIAIYVTANLAYLYVLSAPEVAASQRVAADMMRRVAGPSGAAMVSVAAIVFHLGGPKWCAYFGIAGAFRHGAGWIFFRLGGTNFPLSNASDEPGATRSMVSTAAGERALRGHHQDGNFHGMDFIRHGDCGSFGAAQDPSGNAAALSSVGLPPSTHGICTSGGGALICHLARIAT